MAIFNCRICLVQQHAECQISQFETGQKINQHKRKCWTRFTEYQLHELRKRFKINPFIVGHEKTSLSRKLGLSTQSVKSWFKTERIKCQKANETDQGKQTSIYAYKCS